MSALSQGFRPKGAGTGAVAERLLDLVGWTAGDYPRLAVKPGMG